MPRSTNQSQQASTQCSNQAGASSGGVKYSISICSNSRVRKMKLPGVISFRNALPTWPTPNGGRRRDVVTMFANCTKMPCAVSGRR